VTVRAVSDVDGAVFSEHGLDTFQLGAHVDRTGSVAGFEGGEPLDPADLVTLDVDVLVPAAVESVITADNAGHVQASIIVEGANGPTTMEADAILLERGVVVVPDILANAGGVIVSYFEWVQAHQAYQWTEREVNDRLEERLTTAWHEVVEYSGAHSLTYREAATAIAVRRVTEAHRQRGLYP
jgi:glutamate dehydrogenase (NAD(P)+)